MDPLQTKSALPSETSVKEGPPPKKDYTLVVILSFTTLLGVLIAFFFYFQNQQLRKLVTVVPTPSVSPVPTATTDPTINWKTYENTRFKFSLRYPQALILDNRYENKYPDQGGINIYSKEGYEAVVAETPSGGGSFIEVWIYPNPQSLSLLEWMKNDTAHSNYSNQTYSPINIDGETGYIYTTEGMGKGLEAVVAKNKQIYMFADLGFDNELKQILSTFKFTNTQSTPSASPL